MAKLTNTFVSTDAVGNREELSNVVDRVQRDRTPLYSMIGKEGASSTYPEWERDELEAPGENIRPEGNEYDFDSIQPAERMGNPTQIFTKTFIMSNTQDAVSNAGRAEQFKKKKLDRAIEIRRDVEWAILQNNASVRGETRELGGLPSWITTNVSRGSGGANGGYNSGTGLTVAATNGTQRAWTKTLTDDLMQEAWQNGAMVDTVMCSPYNKRVFTTFQTASNVAQFQMNVRKTGGDVVKSNATIYAGDFGTVTVVPNYIMGLEAAMARNIYFLDTSKLKFKWLRRIAEDKNLAKTGDSMKHALVGEGTLKVTNEKGLGVIADTYGLTASS